MRVSSQQRIVLRAGGLLGASLLAWKLLSHRSQEAWFLGYSFPYFLFLVTALGGLLFVLALLMRLGPRAGYVLPGMALSALVCAGIVELLFHAYAWVRPGYEVVFLQPDRAVGWKQVPGLHWIWTGNFFAAFDYSVPIATNALGFRDVNHDPGKPPGVVRIALLGDSFVEALQVPLENTAGKILERTLNAGAPGPRFEVLDFGISNFSVGQYLLTWDRYARAFAPDVVFIYVSPIQMERTISRYEFGGFGSTRNRRLWVRPVFRLEGDRLIEEPARDYEAFVGMQGEIMREGFDGNRMRRRDVGLVLGRAPDFLRERLRVLERMLGGRSQAPPPMTVEDGTVRINLRVIEALDESVGRSRARLALVDAVVYHGGEVALSRTLQRFCRERGIGYVPLSGALLARNARGIRTRWNHDAHFNEAGNAAFAEAMHRWVIEDAGAGEESRSRETHGR